MMTLKEAAFELRGRRRGGAGVGVLAFRVRPRNGCMPNSASFSERMP